MSTEDEWHEMPPPLEETKPLQQPGITRVAAILWIVLAVFFFLCGFANIVVSSMLAARRANQDPAGTGYLSVWFSFGIGACYFAAGQKLYKGKSKDVLVPSILSILLGLLYLLVAVGAIFTGLGGNELLVLIIVGIAFFIAFGAILPAVLALSGRSQYLAWRAAKREQRRLRRQQRYEEEEEENQERDERDSESKEKSRDRGNRDSS
jgi:hypothetical protein